MRPGLVLLGAALLALAVAGLAALFWVPIPAAPTTVTTSTTWTASPGQSNSTELVGAPALAGSLEIHWQSSRPLDVALYSSGGCPPGTSGCAGWSPAANWTGATAGNWTVSGTVRFPYLLTWANPGAAPASVALSSVTTESSTATLSTLSELVLGLGVGVLGFGGGLALFLGLFLRGGVYGARPPPVSRSAEDVERIAEAPGEPPGAGRH